jgi:hypothetical protein
MLSRVRRFFYSGDPDVKVAGGLTEFDAAAAAELLRNNGIAAMTKPMNFLWLNWGRPMMWAPHHFALWVKQSDAERALALLEVPLRKKQLIRRAPRRLRPRFRRR